MIRRVPAAIACLLLFLLAGCTVGPNYQRPKVNLPAAYRGAPSDQSSAESLGDQKWWTVFQDRVLQNLVRTALQQNFDIRIAAIRVLQAQSQLVITRANQFPTLNGTGSLSGTRSPGIPGVFKAYSYAADEFALGGSWDLDFWGRYRRATEAARATLRETEWGRRAVFATLIENLASAYFQLREYDLELDIAKRTLASRQQSLTLTKTLEQGGATSLVDVRQAEQLVEEAAETIPQTEQAIVQEENQISVLLGQNPTDIPRGRAITEEPLPATVPAGLPSQLLERRPDIRESEQALIASNARIGVARAQLFPQISLTGNGGVESIGLGNLFNWAARTWTWSAVATQPIFNAGSLRANVRLAQAQQQQALLTYEQTLQTAFREVADSLSAYQKFRQYREHQQALTTAAEAAAHLSDVRYQGGVTSYLEVLTNQTTFFSAELNLARARLNERLALVQIYNALGGGWQQ
jgi:multidrug efflux system outer membrane protein